MFKGLENSYLLFFEGLDRSKAEWTPEDLHKVFLDCGCAVIRNAVPLDKLELVSSKVNDFFECGVKYHFSDIEYRSFVGESSSLFDLIDDHLIKAFLERVYHGQSYRKAFGTARRVAGVAPASPTYQQPLQIHIDAAIHDFEFTVNFWIPFQECGLDAPSLQVLPLDYKSTREFVGFTPEVQHEAQMKFGHFRPMHEVFAEEPIKNEFGPDCFFHPVMKAGDLVVASNWLLHGTYQTPTMTRDRSSAEIRLIGTALDIAPYDVVHRGKLV